MATADVSMRPAGSEQLVESAWASPSPVLRPYVAWYVGYREQGALPGLHRGLPSPHLTLIFTLDDPLTLAISPDALTTVNEFDTLIGGLHTDPALVVHPGRQSGIQLALNPLGARAFLGLPAGEIASLDLDAGQVLGPLAAEAADRMRCASSWVERFRVLDALLERQLGRQEGKRFAVGAGLGPRDEVGFVWRRMLAAGGRGSVSDLARDVGWSPRYLGSRFRAEIGLSPKAAARVIRFDRLRRVLPERVAAGATLADLAVEYGYYDQAHLAREFRGLVGCPPTAWLAEQGPAEFRIVQGGDAAVVAGSET